MNIAHASWSNWSAMSNLHALTYTCGYCSSTTGSTHGYTNTHRQYNIYICTNCGLPTLFAGDKQVPEPDIAHQFNNLPDDISAVYKEITSSIQNTNYTGAVLLSRKLLMHIAVEQGAAEGLNFADYVKYLADKGFVPPNADKLLDFIRKTGNQKNHEIILASPEESKKVLKFIESILQFAYELAAEFDEE